MIQLPEPIEKYVPASLRDVLAIRNCKETTYQTNLSLQIGENPLPPGNFNRLTRVALSKMSNMGWVFDISPQARFNEEQFTAAEFLQRPAADSLVRPLGGAARIESELFMQQHSGNYEARIEAVDIGRPHDTSSGQTSGP